MEWGFFGYTGGIVILITIGTDTDELETTARHFRIPVAEAELRPSVFPMAGISVLFAH